jgi:hypothetical protein
MNTKPNNREIKIKIKMKIKGIYSKYEIYLNDIKLDAQRSQSVYNHSDNFLWGYGGSGPSQLALAILLEVTNKETALKYYQDFKFDIIAKLPQKDFEIELDVKKWLNEHKKEN